MRIKTIADFKIGDRESFTKTVTETDVYLFAGITGDFAPQHVNAHYAKQTKFGERIAHGILTAGLVSSALARLVSPGGITLSHTFTFPAPVRFGDTITAEVEVTNIDPEKRLLHLRTICKNQKDEIVLDGTAVEKFPKPHK